MKFSLERDYVMFGYLLSQLRLSSSVTVVHSTQPVEIFRNVSTLFCTLAIRWYGDRLNENFSVKG